MKEPIFLFSNCTLANSQLFFVETQSGLPAMMDPHKGNVVYCDVFDGYFWIKGDIVDFIDCYENNIYILETSGTNLLIFDFIKKQCRYIELNCNEHAWGNFVAFERYESFYYIFPKYGNKIIVLNMNTNEITEISGCFDEMTEIQCACRVEDKVWILSKNTETVYFYDLQKREIKSCKLKRKLEDCVDAVCVDGNVYILNRYGIIYNWSIASEDLQEIRILETEHIEEESVCRIIYAGNKIIVFPALGSEIKILDLLVNEIYVYRGYPKDFLYNDIKWSKYYGYCQDDKNYYIAMRLNNYLLTIRKCDGSFSWIKPNIPLEDEKKMKVQALYEKGKARIYYNIGKKIFGENDINIITLVKEFPHNENILLEKEQVGKIIYEKVK